MYDLCVASTIRGTDKRRCIRRTDHILAVSISDSHIHRPKKQGTKMPYNSVQCTQMIIGAQIYTYMICGSR